MGQFDQAIACWHRVEQAKPHDEEALQAISRLSVEKTIHKGGYDPALLGGDADGQRRARLSGDADVGRPAFQRRPSTTTEDAEQTALAA